MFHKNLIKNRLDEERRNIEKREHVNGGSGEEGGVERQLNMG